MNSEYYPLREYIKKNILDMETFLRLGSTLCKVVHDLHLQYGTCNYLTFDKILVNDKKEVKISEDNVGNEDINKVYKAPEQMVKNTTQVNTSTDIYVLGLLFYEMLLGKVPFEYTDSLTFSHTVLTKEIPFISESDGSIPELISLIIEKMTKINQSDRYHDILSASIDLTKALSMIEAKHTLIPFKVDSYNTMLDLHTSDTIYGREQEAQKIQYIIDAKRGKDNQVILVYGQSGIGKSSLINNVLAKNKDQFSHTFRFKLDYGEQSIPYQVLYKALREKTKQIIAQDDDTLLRYKNKLLNLLGTQVRSLIDIIPEIEMILGKQSYVTNDTKVPFDNLLVQFMGLFTEIDKPFCIYIDDIQWADKVTMDWIKNVVLKLDNIVMFMSYRDETMEVSRNPLFTSMLFELSSYDIKINEVEVLALTEADIVKLIDDNMQLDKSHTIAKLIFTRTKGNPFFVKQYIKQLYKDRTIWFNMKDLTWECDLKQMETLQISDNVFDMLSKTIDDLEPNVRKLLCIASCMGNTFSRDLLEKVFNISSIFDDTIQAALDSGWIIENSTDTSEKIYRFLHDKMQQTIRTFLLGKMVYKVHYKIGCHIESEREDEDKQNLLICVNHLNIGSLYVRDKELLGQLNIDAAIYAKKSGDFDSALKYIKKSMELTFLHTTVENTVDMLKLRAECEHLCNQSDVAIDYYEKALDLATTRLQKAEIYELLIKLYSDITDFSKAYEIGCIATKSFGIRLPKKFIPPLFIVDFLRLKFKLRSFQREDILKLPISNDADFKMTIRLLANTLQSAYQIQPELSVANALIIVKLCLENGLTKESVIGFTVFGVIFQGAILGNHTLGYEYSQLSFEMLKRFKNTTQHAEVKFVCGYFSTSWKQPAIETEANWNIAYKNGLEIGDWFHTGCAAAGIIQSMFMRGVAFEEIFKQIKYFEKIIRTIGAKEQLGALLSVKQALLNLTGQTDTIYSFNSTDFNESEYVKELNTYKSEHFAHYYFINKMITSYIHQDYKGALAVSLSGKKYAKSSKGMLHDTEYLFYHALSIAQLFITTDLVSKIKYKKNIVKSKNKFLRWAKDCPENFLVRAYILEAELCRISRQYKQAFSHYDKAIELANVYGQIHLVAIANRLMAELYEKLGQSKAARLYEDETLRSFHKWGINHIVQKEGDNTFNFDVDTLIKASEVIAKEYEFSSLLHTLIRIIIENAGAQHGFLLLENEGDLLIQASADVDNNTINVMQGISYSKEANIVAPIVQYVLRTKEAIVIEDMTENTIFDSRYSSSRLVKSVLCAPLILHGELKGIIYLENNLLPAIFTDEKVKLLQHLSGQIIISIENSTVYNNLEDKIKQRTRDLEISKEELKLLASLDPMTKLYNRRYFSEISEEMFRMNKKENKSLSFIMLDIDDFKSINDTYGHHVGDKVIIAVGNILKEHTRKNDVVCRYGGEEYMILLSETDMGRCLEISESVRQSVEALNIKIKDGQVLSVTISIGISKSDMSGDDNVEIAINKSDNALYEAKRSGKNRVIQYRER